MIEIEQSILNVFKANSSKEFSTSYLAKEIYTQEYETADTLCLSSDKITIQEGKRKKTELHRKILYYLNKTLTL